MKVRIAAALFVFLLLNSGYLAAYPAASLFYMGNVVAHLGAGLLLMAAAAWALKRYPREGGAFLAAGCVALPLVFIGNTLDHRYILWLHIALGITAAALVAFRFRRRLPLVVPACIVALLLPVSAAVWGRIHPDPNGRIRQSSIASAFDGRGGPGRAITLFAVLRAHHQRADDPLEFLHGFANLRRVPQGYLRTMEEFDAPHGIVQ